MALMLKESVEKSLWYGLRRQYFFTTRDTGHASTHDFEHMLLTNGVNKCIELVRSACQLHGIDSGSDIDNLATKDIRGALEFRALRTACLHLDEHKLTFDMSALGEIDHLDHFHQLVQLLGDPLDLLLVSGRG